MSTDDFQAVETEMAPKLAAFSDQIVQNEELFARIAAVYDARASSGLTPEQKRLVWLDYTQLRPRRREARRRREAARRGDQPAPRDALHEVQPEPARRRERLRARPRQGDRPRRPAGLRRAPAAAAAAEARGHKGQVGDPEHALEHGAVPDVLRPARPAREGLADVLQPRRQRRRARQQRDHHRDPEAARRAGQAARLRDPRPLAARGQHGQDARARPWSSWRRSGSRPSRASTRKSPTCRRSPTQRRRRASRSSPGTIATTRRRCARRSTTSTRTRSSRTCSSTSCARRCSGSPGELFGFQFTPVDGRARSYHPDVRVWEVTDAAGKHVGLWYFDPYARPASRSGAWMNAYRDQERFNGAITTIVSNNANFVKGKPGEPVLISWDDATTMFHEFGHALHGLISNVHLPVARRARPSRATTSSSPRSCSSTGWRRPRC